MSHKIVKNGTTFEIKELATENVIGEFDSHAIASERYRFLKRGGAFGGWTPTFFLTSVKGYIR